ncbi:MAG: arsenate reductase (glutaredoxin) [Rhodospirillaceae bacterium TMED8]|nr:arsenate reductase (glutaredoxin) [Magnetovibrio sp.]OUT48968.1 MAG: arsenate reductase (glutaredoxin) [Rhodospirillaceae bacterium TMED8]
MTTVVYHNSDCGTSRNVVEIIRLSGREPVIIEYLKSGWTRPQLLGLFAVAGITPRDALRIKKSPAEELGLTDSKIDNEKLIDAMIANPILVNRPIVCTPKGVRLCRPSEKVLEILEDSDVGNLLKDGN